MIKVVLFNLSDTNFEIKKGDRIAQLICERIYYPEIQEVEVCNRYVYAKSDSENVHLILGVK